MAVLTPLSLLEGVRSAVYSVLQGLFPQDKAALEGITAARLLNSWYAASNVLFQVPATRIYWRKCIVRLCSFVLLEDLTGSESCRWMKPLASCGLCWLLPGCRNSTAGPTPLQTLVSKWDVTEIRIIWKPKQFWNVVRSPKIAEVKLLKSLLWAQLLYMAHTQWPQGWNWGTLCFRCQLLLSNKWNPSRTFVSSPFQGGVCCLYTPSSFLVKTGEFLVSSWQLYTAALLPSLPLDDSHDCYRCSARGAKIAH